MRYNYEIMKTISILEGQEAFVELVNSAENGLSHLITENDEAVAVMIPYSEYVELTASDEL